MKNEIKFITTWVILIFLYMVTISSLSPTNHAESGNASAERKIMSQAAVQKEEITFNNNDYKKVILPTTGYRNTYKNNPVQRETTSAYLNNVFSLN
ncbi:hypothetical protein VO54_03856 [Elizabethkingia miricola]|nr:hypothetical protein VO54_03856 [Elizabethkingia miricola]